MSPVSGVTPFPAPLSGTYERKAAEGDFQQIFDQAATSAAGRDSHRIASSARQFEALMIGQILKSAHGSESDSWLGAGENDESSSTAIQMAEEYLGQAIANGGGLGIAKMVAKGLSGSGATRSNSAPAEADPSPQRTGSPAQR